MGAKLVNFTIEPEKNEQIEAFIKLPEESRSVIHGVVKDWNDEFVKDAVVKIFEKKNKCKSCDLKPLTHAFTDDCGQFVFGPLISGKIYIIKVWVNRTSTRKIVINPCDCEEDYDKDSCDCEEDYDKNSCDSVIGKIVINPDDCEGDYDKNSCDSVTGFSVNGENNEGVVLDENQSN